MVEINHEDLLPVKSMTLVFASEFMILMNEQWVIGISYEYKNRTTFRGGRFRPRSHIRSRLLSVGTFHTTTSPERQRRGNCRDVPAKPIENPSWVIRYDGVVWINLPVRRCHLDSAKPYEGSTLYFVIHPARVWHLRRGAGNDPSNVVGWGCFSTGTYAGADCTSQ